ncbi:MAG: Lrp/AsnC family transcriptional regulator [Bacillota bacterium]
MRYKILEILEKNSKATPKQIAGMLGLNESMVAEEIISMENERIILQYGAIINWEKASNKDMVIALIDVKVTPQRDVGFDQLAAKIYKYPEVREIFLMSGSYDFSVQVVGKNLKEIADFVGKKLAIIDGVQSTTTHFVLKKYKVAHVILEDDEKDRRQVITP